MKSVGPLLLLFLLGVLAPAALSQSVVVDGDLADIKLAAQGDQSDPFNEICLLSKSGFDLRWAYVYYDEALDILYFGLDLMDVPDPDFAGAVGRNGPGVPGDADGDEDPDTADEASCPVQEEQADVGPDEIYMIKVDTNSNGMFNEFNDLRIIYRGNNLSFEHGDSTPMAGVTAEVVLGTAGAPVDPLLPNQNRNTEDIEIAVHDWTTIDPIPQCFIVTTFSGSLVDGFPEDNLITPIEIQLAAPSVSITKDVRDVTAGGPFQDNVSVEIGDTVEFRMFLTNTGNVDLDPAAIVDTLPEELDFIPGSVVGADTVTTNPVPGGLEITMRSLGGDTLLPAGVTREVTFQATVLPTLSGAAVNSAEGGGRPPGECAAQDATATDDATVSLVDLVCTKQVSLDQSTYADALSASRGQTVFFRVTVQNPSGVDLQDTQMTDTLPAGYENIVADSPGCTIIGQTITCDIGVLPAFGSVTVDYHAGVASSASGTLVNTADCTANFDEAIFLETQCSAEVTVLVPNMICNKEVSLDGTNYFDSVDAITGFEVFFRVVVTNTGDAPLWKVTLDDTLPAGFGGVTLVSGAGCGVAGQTVSCPNVGPLNPTESATVIYKAAVTATNPPTASLTNIADCSGTAGTEQNPGDQVQTQCDATVNLLSPCVVCAKEVSLDGVNYLPAVDAVGGEHVWFRITVNNCGTTPLTNLVLSDPLSPMLANPATADPDCGIAGGTFTCATPALATGLDWIVIFEADIDAAASGTILNTASVTATPAVQGIPGDDIGTQCSAQINVGPLEIPTLSQWGAILLCALLALTLILHNRFRHHGAPAQD